MNIQENLKAYVDGELSPADAEQVRLAIESNPALAREVEAIRSIGSVIQLNAKAYTPIGMNEALRAIQAKRKTPWYMQPWTWGAGLAGTAAVAFAFYVNRPPTADSSLTTAIAAVSGPVAMNDKTATSRPVPSVVPAPQAPDRPSKVPTQSKPLGTLSDEIFDSVSKSKASEVAKPQLAKPVETDKKIANSSEQRSDVKADIAPAKRDDAALNLNVRIVNSSLPAPQVRDILSRVGATVVVDAMSSGANKIVVNVSPDHLDQLLSLLADNVNSTSAPKAQGNSAGFGYGAGRGAGGGGFAGSGSFGGPGKIGSPNNSSSTYGAPMKFANPSNANAIGPNPPTNNMQGGGSPAGSSQGGNSQAGNTHGGGAQGGRSQGNNAQPTVGQAGNVTNSNSAGAFGKQASNSADVQNGTQNIDSGRPKSASNSALESTSNRNSGQPKSSGANLKASSKNGSEVAGRMDATSSKKSKATVTVEIRLKDASGPNDRTKGNGPAPEESTEAQS